MSTLNNKVYIDGVFQFVKTENLQSGPLTFPNSDGTNGQLLGTDGKGHLSFITIPSGDVSGPGSSTDDSIVLFNGTTGKLLKGSLGSIDGFGKLTIPSLVASGLTYPTSDGTNGQILTTDGFGDLSFANNSAVSGPASSTDDSLARWNGTTGKAIKDSNTFLDNLGHLFVPALTLGGAVLFPSVDGTLSQVLTTAGAGSASWQSVPTRLLGLQNAPVASDIGVGDHIKYNTVLGSNGTNISLDTTTAYSNIASQDSIGRFKLKTGHTYILSSTMQSLTFLLSSGSFTAQFYDSDSDVPITTGTTISILGTVGLNGTNAPTATAVVTPPGIDTRYELRITSAVSLASTGITILDIMQLI